METFKANKFQKTSTTQKAKFNLYLCLTRTMPQRCMANGCKVPGILNLFSAWRLVISFMSCMSP